MALPAQRAQIEAGAPQSPTMYGYRGYSLAPAPDGQRPASAPGTLHTPRMRCKNASRIGGRLAIAIKPNSRAIACGHVDVAPVHARLWAEWSERGLLRLGWSPAGSSAASALGPARPPEADLAEPYCNVLEAYFAGGNVDPSVLPVELEGTPFQHKVWQALRDIPRGRVRSYAAVASAIGSPRAMRAVGGANGRNPLTIVVPCHRVVEAGMRIGGYTGGLHIKRFLLELEGARIVGDHVQPGQLELI
jgi:O-6-methylguanine DNA methyltransferase